MLRYISRIALVLPFLFTGCIVRSLSPIYTDKDLVPMPAVEGTWKGESEGESIAFAREGDGYAVTCVGNELPLIGLAHFAKIDRKTYLDITFKEPGEDSVKLDDQTQKVLDSLVAPFIYYTTPVHVFYQVEVRDNVLRMRSMNYAWAKERREKGRLWIAHFADGDSTLLTADTPRVQRFLRRWANTDAAWDSWNETPLVPIPAAPSTPTP